MQRAKPQKRKQTERVVRHYAALAGEYDRKWDRYTRASLGTLMKQLDLSGEERLLDAACGTGRFAEMLRARHPNLRITGTDLSPEMIAVARRRQPENELTRWQVVPAESLPFEDGSFDAVTCANAFHLIPDQHKALREFARVARPGATVCIVDWCREYVQIRALQAFSRVVGKQYRIILTRDELREMMQRAGLRVRNAVTFKATWFWGLMCVTATRE
jgi:ubiquinone/menaquinone biosynthesis C-methylase UbiE